MAKRVKIKDIAGKCGFSNTLVSLVLNNKAALYGIKADTQEKVIYAARQMGYFEDVKPERSKTSSLSASNVGMIVPDLDSHFLFELGPSLVRAFSSIGLLFSIIPRNTNVQIFSMFLDDIKKMYSGVILMGDAADDLTVSRLKEKHFPFLVLEKKLTGHRINEIYTDIEQVYRLVALHILKLGYKRVSVIERRNCRSCIIESRQLTDNIQKIVPGIIISKYAINDNLRFDKADEAEIVKALRPPIASELFLVKHSELVYPLLAFLKRKSFRVPGDIALISLDGGIGFDLLDPPITRINRNYSQLALKVSQMLWSEVRNDGRSKYKRSVKISPELIIEKSCGAIL